MLLLPNAVRNFMFASFRRRICCHPEGASLPFAPEESETSAVESLRCAYREKFSRKVLDHEGTKGHETTKREGRGIG
jgi:hypothetical protein